MHECAGSGRELPDDPPPARAATCPVCGRETKVDPTHDAGDGGGLGFVIAPHDSVAD